MENDISNTNPIKIQIQAALLRTLSKTMQTRRRSVSRMHRTLLPSRSDATLE